MRHHFNFEIFIIYKENMNQLFCSYQGGDQGPDKINKIISPQTRILYEIPVAGNDE